MARQEKTEKENTGKRRQKSVFLGFEGREGNGDGPFYGSGARNNLLTKMGNVDAQPITMQVFLSWKIQRLKCSRQSNRTNMELGIAHLTRPCYVLEHM